MMGLLVCTSLCGSWCVTRADANAESSSFSAPTDRVLTPTLPINTSSNALDGESTQSSSFEKSPSSLDSSQQHRLMAANIRGGSSTEDEVPPDSSMSPGLSFSNVLQKAFVKGLGGGIPGAIAGVVQVLTLMWLRTLINYQCRYGTTFQQSIKILYQQGGIGRFYQGLEWAIIQAPLVRFVSTFSNDGVTLLWNYYISDSVGSSTAAAALVVGVMRIVLMPMDTIKTVLQVDSHKGFAKIKARLAIGQFGVLYQGAVATALSSTLAHYPWFFTFTILSNNETLKAILPDSSLIQNAIFGFCASIISDVTVNAIRVIKTTKQTLGSHRGHISYSETIHSIVSVDGVQGLMGRGLKARILSNGIQSVVFAVIWRGLAEEWSKLSDSRQAVIEEPSFMAPEQSAGSTPGLWSLATAPDVHTTISKSVEIVADSSVTKSG